MVGFGQNLVECLIQIFLVRLPSAAPPGFLGQSNPWISLCESSSQVAEDTMFDVRPFGLRCLSSHYGSIPLPTRPYVAADSAAWT